MKTLRAHRASTRRGAYWRFDFEANAFLHHMIRNIMGCLLAVGSGTQPPGWMRRGAGRARAATRRRRTFPPDGLYFLGPGTTSRSWDLPEPHPLRMIGCHDAAAAEAA